MRVEVKLGGWWMETIACDGQREKQIDRMISLDEFITGRSSPSGTYGDLAVWPVIPQIMDGLRICNGWMWFVSGIFR